MPMIQYAAWPIRRLPGLAVAVVAGGLWAAPMVYGQFVTPEAPAETGPNLPAQPIGPNDLLAISVYGAPELSRTVRVSEEGLIRLPMLHDKIAVLGLMPAELETRIAEALETAQILVEPAVSVSVAEYHSHPISVVGAVKVPLTFQAVGRTSLVEAITRAQGLAEDAGAEILISRPGKNGAAPALERVAVKGLIDGADPGLNLNLEGGEEVRVPTIGRVYVVGNVKRPGNFRLDEAAGMSVLKALAMSEGLAPYAAKLAYIYRRNGGAASEIPVELRKIMDRKAEDVPLAANDILYIPDNRSGRAALTVLERVVGFATATASGALIVTHPGF
jgi:polysaccharide biosynthesis/export protein